MSYPPNQTNAIQQALDRRDTMMSIPLSESTPDQPLHEQQQHDAASSREDQIPGEEKEAMRLRGGCFSLEPCGSVFTSFKFDL
ncbi:uncharacterized protein JCM6883_002877 [Sporobolomyces salmoneus]|uniref:uncharacterized protein n=1 Tax=Sporobolomyces salmoneus TaxID=183962 RepID=UPI00316F1CE2